MTPSFHYDVPPCPELYHLGAMQLMRKYAKQHIRRYYAIKAVQALLLAACYIGIVRQYDAMRDVLWEWLPEEVYAQISDGFAIITGLLLAMLAVTLAARYVWAKYFYRRFYTSGLVALPGTFDADEAGIRQQHADHLSHGFTAWAAVRDIEPINGGVLFDLGSNLIVLPAAVFADDNEQKMFIQQTQIWQQAAQTAGQAA